MFGRPVWMLRLVLGVARASVCVEMGSLGSRAGGVEGGVGSSVVVAEVRVESFSSSVVRVCVVGFSHGGSRAGLGFVTCTRTVTRGWFARRASSRLKPAR